MTNFKLNKPLVIYKIERGKVGTISNSKMTDALAIQFLTINPDRISLFSDFPENWKELIGLENVNTHEEEPTKPDFIRNELKDLSIQELRDLFPTISARAKGDFINKVLNP